jgi:hypothetical protein
VITTQPISTNISKFLRILHFVEICASLQIFKMMKHALAQEIIDQLEATDHLERLLQKATHRQLIKANDRIAGRLFQLYEQRLAIARERAERFMTDLNNTVFNIFTGQERRDFCQHIHDAHIVNYCITCDTAFINERDYHGYMGLLSTFFPLRHRNIKASIMCDVARKIRLHFTISTRCKCN